MAATRARASDVHTMIHNRVAAIASHSRDTIDIVESAFFAAARFFLNQRRYLNVYLS